MKAMRVNKLKQILDGLNPSQKVWFSEQEVELTYKEFIDSLGVDEILHVSNLIELHKYKLAQEILTVEQRRQLYELGFSITKDVD
jgi:phage anti-repressor protein